MRGPPRGQVLFGAAAILSLALFTSLNTSSRPADLHAAEVPLTVRGPLVLEAQDSAVTVAVMPDEAPLTRERLVELVRATWPEDPDTAERILICESHAGDDPRTYDVEAPNGGPMQLDRYTWEPFFSTGYGWSWEQVVTDIRVHLQASRIIYDRSSGWTPWRC